MRRKVVSAFETAEIFDLVWVIDTFLNEGIRVFCTKINFFNEDFYVSFLTLWCVFFVAIKDNLTWEWQMTTVEFFKRNFLGG